MVSLLCVLVSAFLSQLVSFRSCAGFVLSVFPLPSHTALDCLASGAQLFYTLDGQAADNSSTPWPTGGLTPLQLSVVDGDQWRNATLCAFCQAPGFTSAHAFFSYQLRPRLPPVDMGDASVPAQHLARIEFTLSSPFQGAQLFWRTPSGVVPFDRFVRSLSLSFLSPFPL